MLKRESKRFSPLCLEGIFLFVCGFSRARIYPSNSVFLLSPLSHEAKKGAKKGGHFCPKEGTRDLFLSCAKTCDSNPLGFHMVKSPRKQDNAVFYRYLQNTVTDVTAKNIKL